MLGLTSFSGTVMVLRLDEARDHSPGSLGAGRLGGTAS